MTRCIYTRSGLICLFFNVMLCRVMFHRLHNYDSRSAQSLQSQISVASPS